MKTQAAAQIVQLLNICISPIGLQMIAYANLSGNSGIAEYELGEDYIKIRFRDESKIYVYDDHAPGASDVRTMHALAISGRGLSAYIAQHIRNKYSRTE